MRRNLAVTAALLPVLSLGAVPDAQGAEPTCATPTITGTAGDDELVGTEGPDVIVGLGGRDRIAGLGGDDVLCGGEEADVLIGGPGDDRLDGGADSRHEPDPGIFYVGGDVLSGGPGDDLLDGGVDPRHQGHDVLDYSDSVAGVTVDLAARIATGEGSDTLGTSFNGATGSAFADVLRGTDRGDVLVGQGGADRLLGRDGPDELITGFPDDRPRERRDPTPNRASGGPGIDDVRGDVGDDVLRGGADMDFLRAGGGFDRVLGDGGRDHIDDELPVGSGTTVIDPGGQGRETVSVGVVDRRGRALPAARVRGRIDLAAGRLRGRAGDHVVRARLVDVHGLFAPRGSWTVLGTAGRDWLGAGGYRHPVRLFGRGGDDVMTGSWGSDLFDGGLGHDRAYGTEADVYRSIERRS